MTAALLLATLPFSLTAPAIACLRRMNLAGDAMVEPGPLAHRPMGTQD